MNKTAIIKIVGFLVVPIIVMLVVIYLLYPLLNKERYDLIVETGGMMSDSTMVDSLIVADSLAQADSLMAAVEIEQPAAVDDTEWVSTVDSLERVIYVLSSRLEGLEKKEEVNTVQAKLQDEAFKDRVKSLLNLEEDELAPILDKMTNKQLVQLYSEAGNTQREKILRSLNSDRAARLITEIML